MNRLANLWNRIFPVPRATDEAKIQLAQAELDLLYACSQAEYYDYLTQMLRQRVARLKGVNHEA